MEHGETNGDTVKCGDCAYWQAYREPHEREWRGGWCPKFKQDTLPGDRCAQGKVREKKEDFDGRK